MKINLENLSQSSAGRDKREANNLNLPSGAGQLVNFTEIDLPDNFMEAE